jgi:hypothetical protein
LSDRINALAAARVRAGPLTAFAERVQNPRMERLRLLGAAGGAAFAVLVLTAFAIAPGPSSAKGVTVVEYYSAHRTATLWQAVLLGFALVFFVWFAGTFAGRMSCGPAVLASAAPTAALYLVAIGCWESLGETYGGVEITSVPSESYGDAHVLYDVGVGATHLANFMDAAFIGATAAALLTAATPWRRLGWIGIGLTLVQLVNAPLQIFATSDWSDGVGAVVFLTLMAWVFGLSAALVVSIRRVPVAVPAAPL